jgi:hypothetical protein
MPPQEHGKLLFGFHMKQAGRTQESNHFCHICFVLKTLISPNVQNNAGLDPRTLHCQKSLSASSSS